jgi:hypothetical protein
LTSGFSAKRFVPIPRGAGRDEMGGGDVGPGEGVQVRNRFDGNWVQGFEVAEVTETGHERQFRIRRRSDGAILPALFPEADVRGASAGRPAPADTGS